MIVFYVMFVFRLVIVLGLFVVLVILFLYVQIYLGQVVLVCEVVCDIGKSVVVFNCLFDGVIKQQSIFDVISWLVEVKLWCDYCLIFMIDQCIVDGVVFYCEYWVLLEQVGQ